VKSRTGITIDRHLYLKPDLFVGALILSQTTLRWISYAILVATIWAVASGSYGSGPGTL
jgi:hypothetical protein